jgi:hypothetical protein
VAVRAGAGFAPPTPKSLIIQQKSLRPPQLRRADVQSWDVLANVSPIGCTRETTMVAVQTNGKAPAASDLLAQIEALKAENAKLKEARNAKLSMKVSDKGALSVYGLGRFPVTLYRGQWERLIEIIPSLQALVAENASKLAVKE